MVLYECVTALGLECRVAPVMQGVKGFCLEDEFYDYDEEPSSDESFFTDYAGNFDSDISFSDDDWWDDVDESITDEQREEKRAINAATEVRREERLKSLREEHEQDLAERRERRDERQAFKARLDADLDEFRKAPAVCSGELQPTRHGGPGVYDYDGSLSWGQVLGTRDQKDVLWITKPKHKAVQLAYMAVSLSHF